MRYVIAPNVKPKPTAMTVETLKARRAAILARLKELQPMRSEVERLVEERRNIDALIGVEK